VANTISAAVHESVNGTFSPSTLRATAEAEDFAAIFDTLKSHADAIYVVPDPFINVNRTRITTLALGARLATIHGFREFVEAGGLMSYGPNWTDMFGRAAGYVDKILRSKTS
jgi:putative tryptophan/tyrosine transport system substrate-binding protein